MSQPEWEIVYQTDYSTLYRDKTGEHEAELEVRQEIEDTLETDSTGVETMLVEYYRFPLDRLKLVTDPTDPLKQWLVPFAYEPSWPYALSQYEEWFTKDLPSIASSASWSVAELIAALTGDDIRARALAYEDIGGYWGYDNFDGYPQRVREEI